MKKKLGSGGETPEDFDRESGSEGEGKAPENALPDGGDESRLEARPLAQGEEADNDAAKDAPQAGVPGESEEAPEALAARLAAQEKALAEQVERHRKAQQNARKSHAARQRALLTSVGSLAVTHNLVDLTAFELEGAFVDLAARMADPAERARWAELGQKAASEREAARRPDEIFYIGVNGASEACRTALHGAGCKFSTRSSKFATFKSKTLPEALIELAKQHGQAIWTLDEDLEKVFVHRPQTGKDALADRLAQDAQKTAEAGRRMGFAQPRFSKPSAPGEGGGTGAGDAGEKPGKPG